jgi:putative spermidine/putrescine transport system permease protein
MVAVDAAPGSLVPSARAAAPRRGRAPWSRYVVLVVAAIYFLGPMAAAFWFTIHNDLGTSFRAYDQIASAPGLADALALSLELGAVTVALSLALLVPTVVLVHLRYPKVRPLIEVLSLFPLVVPPIVIVVGVGKILAWGNEFPGGTFTGELFNQLQNSNPPFILALEYAVLVLPFSYRAIDAGLRGSGIQTLVEAASNLGASWLTILWRVVLPVLRTAVLTAAVLGFALVVGEFTMSSILQYLTFPVWLLQFQNTDGQLSVALALMSLLLTWLVLIGFTFIAGRDRSTRKAES